MTDERKGQGKTRRDFLKDMTLAGGGLAASAMLPGAAVAAAQPGATEAEAQHEEGYRVTEHIARYYETLER